MKHKTLIDRLVTFGLALILVVAVSVAYQMGARSGASSASEALAAGAAVTASTGYISVPAAAFVPEHYLVNYTNEGNKLYLSDGYESLGSFYAPLHLPHGATVTKLTLNYYDNNGLSVHFYVYLNMYRSENGGVNEYMAAVESSTDGYGSKSNNSISLAEVDNSRYSYYLSVGLPDDEDLEFHEALIEFTYPTTFVPLTLRNF